MPLVDRLPDTGSEISMGRVSKAMGLTLTAGAIQVSLNATLGANRSKLSGSVLQNANIAGSTITSEGSDFGGMSASFTY
jgi:hypothetical protein